MKKDWFSRLRYRFDCLMSRGMAAMIRLLFYATMLIICLIGLLARLFSGEGSLWGHIWFSLMHTLDAGNLAGTSTENIPYLFMMAVATLCGLFLTSILIGIISTGIEARLSVLRKGTSTVQEEDHTVIIGFNDSIYTILSELIEANSNHENACVVVLGEEEKEEMEDRIAAHFPDTRTTRVICRSGRLHEALFLERCAVEKCRSVIVNIYEDTETIKVILGLSAYIKDNPPKKPDLHFTAVIREAENVEIARIAGEGSAEIIYATDAIARIIAHTCRQHGLSQVMTELLDFEGDEIYFESVPSLTGKTFAQALNAFSNATLLGICREGKVRLNPPMDTVLAPGDTLALLEEDDGAFRLSAKVEVEEEKISADSVKAPKNCNMVVLGSNEKLPIILKEYDLCVAKGTRVIVVDEDLREERLVPCENLEVTAVRQSVSTALMEELLTQDIETVLLLNDDSEEPQRSDSRTLFHLVLLRNIADRTGRQFSITTEMQCSDNQRLALRARVDDFVIGNDIMNLLMTQIAENRLLMPLFNELLDESGSELYTKPITNYVRPGERVNFFTLTESAARKGEVFVGYRRTVDGQPETVLNLEKEGSAIFGEDDLVIVVASDREP